LLSNDYYNDLEDPNLIRKLTCVIGARGADGCVIISDTRETTGSEYKDVEKIRILWNNKGAIACAGDGPLIANMVETINGISKLNSGKLVKDIVDENVRSVLRINPPVTTQYPPVPKDNPFKAIFMGLKEIDNGESYIRLIDPRGFSTSIDDFEIIGMAINT
jgi:20S proteasome alpha/beta subunit